MVSYVFQSKGYGFLCGTSICARVCDLIYFKVLLARDCGLLYGELPRGQTLCSPISRMGNGFGEPNENHILI